MQDARAPRGRPRKAIAVETIWRDRRDDGDTADIRARLILLRDACRRRWPELLDQDFADYSGLSRERMKHLMQRGVGKFEWTPPEKGDLQAKNIDISRVTPGELLIERIMKRLERPEGIAPPIDYFTRKVSSVRDLEAMVLPLMSAPLTDVINLSNPGTFVVKQQPSRLKLQRHLLSFLRKKSVPVGQPLYVVYAATQKYGLVAFARHIIAEWMKSRETSETTPIFAIDFGDNTRRLDLPSMVKKLAEFFQFDRDTIDGAEAEPERVLGLVAERAAETSALFLFCGWRGNGGDPLAATRRLVREDPALDVLTALVSVQSIGARSHFVVFSEGRPNELRHLTAEENFQPLPTAPLADVAKASPMRLDQIDDWIRKGIVNGAQETDDLTCDLVVTLVDLGVPAEEIVGTMEQTEAKERHMTLCRRLLETIPPSEAGLLKLLSVAEVGLGPQACSVALKRIDSSSTVADLTADILQSLSAKMPRLVYNTGDQLKPPITERSERQESFEVDPTFRTYIEHLWAEAAPFEVVATCRALAALADEQAIFARQEADGKFGQYLRDYRQDVICCLLLGKSLMGRGTALPTAPTPTRPFVGGNIFSATTPDELVARALYDTLLLHNLEKAPQYRLTRDFGADDIRLELLSLLLLGRSILREPFTEEDAHLKPPHELVATLFDRADGELLSVVWCEHLIAQNQTDGDSTAWRRRFSRIVTSFAVAAHRLKADKLVDFARRLATTVEPLPLEDAVRLGKIVVDSLINQGRLSTARVHCDALLKDRLGVALPTTPEDLAAFLKTASSDAAAMTRACTDLLCRRAVIEHLSGQAETSWSILSAIRAIDDLRAAREFVTTPTLTGHPSRIMLKCAILRAMQHETITVKEWNDLTNLIERIHLDNWRRMGDVRRELPWLHLETSIVERGLAKALADREKEDDTAGRLDRARLALDRARNSIWQGGPNHALPYLHYLLEKSETELQRFELASKTRYLSADDMETAWRECVDSAQHLDHLAKFYGHELLTCDAQVVLADAYMLRHRLAVQNTEKSIALSSSSSTETDPTGLAEKVEKHLSQAQSILATVDGYHLQETRAKTIKKSFLSNAK